MQCCRRQADNFSHVPGIVMKENEKTKAKLVSDPEKGEASGENPRFLASAARQTSAALAILDLEGNLLFANRAFATLHGYTPGELVGKHFSIFHAPDQMAAVEASIRQLRETGEFTGEILHVRRDGTVFPTMMHNSIFREGAGNAIAMIGSFIDISERKRVEKALEKSEEHHRLLAENIPIHIGSIDKTSGKFTAWNRYSENMLGYTAEEAIGKLTPADIHETKEEAKEAIRTASKKGLYDREINLRHKDGRLIPSHLVVVPYKDVKGKIIHFYGFAMDITMRRKAEEKLRNFQDKIEKMVEERTAELARVNKELLRKVRICTKAEKQIRDYAKQCRAQKEDLEEKNVALRQVLGQLEVEKKHLRDDVMGNILTLLLPMVRKLKKEEAPIDKKYLKVLEFNLNNLASSFGRKLSRPRLKLTPRETEICDMIRSGLGSKDIASLLKLSQRTVEKNRDNIRRKCGLRRHKINLASFLKTL